MSNIPASVSAKDYFLAIQQAGIANRIHNAQAAGYHRLTREERRKQKRASGIKPRWGK